MDIDLNHPERSVRTLFVSDVHLGCRFAQSEQFLSYLNSVRPEQLYLLGDFLDGWKLRAKWRWNGTYASIFRRLIDLAERGTEIFYTPGNHDAFLRDPIIGDLLDRCGLPVQVRDEFIHETADGRRYVLLHGDRFDVVECKHQWLSHLLVVAYEPLLAANRQLHSLWGGAKGPYSVCALVKNQVKSLARFFSHFEQRLSDYALERECDGLICGHIHTPGITELPQATYVNTGDWVENCTAVVETHDGQLVLESFYDQIDATLAWSGANSRHDENPASLAPSPEGGEISPALADAVSR